jgi:hypothetical protein
LHPSSGGHKAVVTTTGTSHVYLGDVILVGLDGKVLRVYDSLHHNSLRKNPNANEGSVFLVTRCSLNSGSSAKVVYKLLIVLSPSVSQKSFYYKFKTVPSRPFVALKELVEVFVLDKVSYLWTIENTFFTCRS